MMKFFRKIFARIKKEDEGFTLIELMIVIAIIAILAAVAITQYTQYKNKAKAKELVSFSRNCIMAITTKCASADTTWNNVASLPQCQNPADTKYLSGITIDTSAFTQCGDLETGDLAITATGTIKGTTTQYQASCKYDHTSGEIACTQPEKI